MKKLSSLLLSLLILFSVTGCGADTNELAGAVLDAAIDAVENYESSVPEDSNALDTVGGADGPTSIFVTGPDDSGDTSFSPADPDEIGVIGGADGPTSILVSSSVPDEDGYYYDLENVVLYLDFYGVLPDNYITKDEARALGWKGGTPERYLEGAAIGGDRFSNREGLLPKGNYTECDLNTLGEDERGPERLVFSDDGCYYHTEDHYKSFTQVWVEEGEVIYE